MSDDEYEYSEPAVLFEERLRGLYSWLCGEYDGWDEREVAAILGDFARDVMETSLMEDDCDEDDDSDPGIRVLED